MADMLAHVEEAANEGETLKEEGNGSEDMESVQHRLVNGQCFYFWVDNVWPHNRMIIIKHTI